MANIKTENLVTLDATLVQNQRVLIMPDKTAYIPIGVGSNEVPGGGTTAVPGYFINTNGTITFQPAAGGTASAVSSVYLPDTGQDEPEYAGSVDIDAYASMILKFGTTIPAYTQTGNSIDTIGSPTVETDNGIQCLHCNNSGLRIELESFANYYNGLDFAVSYWIKGSNIGRDALVFCSQQDYATGKNLCLGNSVNQADTKLCEYDGSTSSWKHFLVNYANGSGELYVNGTLEETFTLSTPSMTSRTRCFIGGLPVSWSYDGSSFGEYAESYIANVRIFYKHISADHIAALYSELTPTNA